MADSQTTLMLGTDYVFSGPGDPGGTAPWVLAAFENSGTGTDGVGKVTLTLTADNLSPGEFVSQLYLNLNPALDAANLNFQAIQNNTVSVTGIAQVNNDLKADGDGKYDIRFDFSSASGDGRFAQGDILQYDITYLTGGSPDTLAELSANYFDFLSEPAGGKGPFRMAVHILGIGEDSAWVAQDPEGGGYGIPIPEPSTYAATLGVAVLAFVAFRRRRALSSH